MLRIDLRLEGRELAGATGLEPAASCVTGGQTVLGERSASRKVRIAA